MPTQTEQDEELTRLQAELDRLSAEQRDARARYQREIDVVTAKIRAVTHFPDWESRPDRLQARRQRVLEMLFEERDPKHIARALGVTRYMVDNDVWRLRVQGLYPVRLADSSDEVARRRNHVLRVWSYSTVKTVADAIKFLPDLDQDAVKSDLLWLAQHGYVDFSPPAETPREETPAAAARAPAAPPAPGPPPGRTPPKTSPGTKVATTEELLEEVDRRCHELGIDEVTIRTSTSRKHAHNALLDRRGDGLTAAYYSDHQHEVRRFCVLPKDKHTHELVLP